jgi:hypothetical protein
MKVVTLKNIPCGSIVIMPRSMPAPSQYATRGARVAMAGAASRHCIPARLPELM